MKLFEIHIQDKPEPRFLPGPALPAGSKFAGTNAPEEPELPHGPRGVPDGSEAADIDPDKKVFIKGNITAHPDDDEQSGRRAVRSPSNLKSSGNDYPR